jgi:hypothetical protein
MERPGVGMGLFSEDKILSLACSLMSPSSALEKSKVKERRYS